MLSKCFQIRLKFLRILTLQFLRILTLQFFAQVLHSHFFAFACLIALVLIFFDCTNLFAFEILRQANFLSSATFWQNAFAHFDLVKCFCKVAIFVHFTFALTVKFFVFL